ncbi:MAG: signal peptidase II [Rhodocyclaceae bacterium]|nr:signal peptidase II [Rhodocyclaceae bacterium]
MPRFAAWLGLSTLVIVLDQITKFMVVGSLSLGAVIPVNAFFDLVHIHNRGAAFSFLAHEDGWQKYFFIALALGICSWMLVLLRRHAAEKIAPLAFALIIGGALGNVIDRVLYGAVVDFLYFHVANYGWPAFNLADSAITLGVGLMVWEQTFGHCTEKT